MRCFKYLPDEDLGGACDVREGIITRARAREVYGVEVEGTAGLSTNGTKDTKRWGKGLAAWLASNLRGN